MTERGGLVTCAGGSIADRGTGPDGQTTFSQPIAGGGHSDLAGDERTLVLVSGMPLEQPGLPMRFNSADIDGDLHVNLSDVSRFAQNYFVNYDYRSDFTWDGAINLADLSRLASAIAAVCSSGEPVPTQETPAVGEVAISFARDVLLTSLAVAPGQVFQAHLLVTGSAAAAGIVGLQGSLHTTDNLEIVRWTFASRQINVAEAPGFAVGFAEPQVEKADQPVCALTVELRARDDQPAAIYLNFDPATGRDQGPVLCTLGQDAALASLSRRDRGDAGAPAARINAPDETAAASTPAGGLVDGSLRNAPNPFNPSTDIHFDLARAGRVEVRIYDASGRLVRRLAGEMRNAGSGSVHWDGRDEQGQALASGLYFSQIFVDGATTGRTVKMSLVR